MTQIMGMTEDQVLGHRIAQPELCSKAFQLVYSSLGSSPWTPTTYTHPCKSTSARKQSAHKYECENFNGACKTPYSDPCLSHPTPSCSLQWASSSCISGVAM